MLIYCRHADDYFAADDDMMSSLAFDRMHLFRQMLICGAGSSLSALSARICYDGVVFSNDARASRPGRDKIEIERFPRLDFFMTNYTRAAGVRARHWRMAQPGLPITMGPCRRNTISTIR